MSAEGQLVRIDGHRMRVTNLDRIVYPETGTTKGEVISYYVAIAPAMLPLLRDRPVTRKRWVDGAGTAQHPGGSFFAKQAEPGMPEWIPHASIEHRGGTKEYPLATSTAALAWFAQVAALELHVPQWRIGRDGARAAPDRLVLDLDPGPGAGLPECAEVARLARTILLGMGLDPIPVTSGSKGIHLYAPLPAADGPTRTSAQVAEVARELARAIEAAHPLLAVSSMSKSKRQGRVLIDWSQNNAAKTTISPYSLRGLSRPWAAAPRTWAELDDPSLDQLTMDQVLARVAEGVAPFPSSSSPDALAEYLAKRRPGRTPEPMPSPAEASPASISGTAPRFVVQEHHARRLHFDLRIEHDGVLSSWAVPKGIPREGDPDRLAVQTEAHPLEYLEFEGAIPEGEYGAGSLRIWDRGTVTIEKWRDDEIIGTFTGRDDGPLGVARLALIRTETRDAGSGPSWLLHRMRPATHRAHRPPRRTASSGPSAPASRTLLPYAPMLAETGTPALARTLSDPAWAEIKWDGIRALGTWHTDSSSGIGALSLQTRTGTDVTSRYPELTGTAAPRLPVSDAVLDGEIVAFDDTGRPRFARLQHRMRLTRDEEISRERAQTPVAYLLFDLLRLEGRDLTGFPLRDRRALLTELATAFAPPLHLTPVFDDLDAALRASVEQELEGIMAKDPASPYLPGVRSPSWLKLVHTRTQSAVIVGIRPGRGEREGTFGSLLLALPDERGQLRYIGRVGTGFRARTLRELGARLDTLRCAHAPLDDVPAVDATDAQWVRPELICEVEFLEWTPNGLLRQARWRGLRPDIDLSSLRRE